MIIKSSENSGCIMSDHLENNRTAYLDHLRVAASFAVMMIHVVSFTWYTPDLQDLGWKTYCFFGCISRWGVPAFVMISGVLFLNRDIPIKKLYQKYILRLAAAFFAWSAFYAFTGSGTLSSKFHAFLKGPFHMWFVLMMIGLYICTPLIRKIISDKKTTVYFLAAGIIFGFIIPTCSMMISHFGGGIINRIASDLDSLYSNMHIYMLTGYTIYFVLGYYLNGTDLKQKQRLFFYCLGALGFAMTILLTFAVSRQENRLDEHYFDNLTLNLLLCISGIFVLFKYRNYTHAKLNRLMAKLSKFSFGAYIIHMFVLGKLKRAGLPGIFPHPIFRVMGTCIITFIISYLISAILNQIPFVKKYLV